MNGVLFYVDFAKMNACLAVATHSLRRFYDGPIHVEFGPSATVGLVDRVRRLANVTVGTNSSPCNTDIAYSPKLRNVWCQKPFAIRRSPFGKTIYYDADHLFRDFSPSLFDMHGAIGTAHANPTPVRERHRLAKIGKRFGLDAMRKVNGGFVWWDRTLGAESMETWIKIMRQLHPMKLAEEDGLAVAINSLGFFVDVVHSFTVSRGSAEIRPGTEAIHFAKNSWRDSAEWNRALGFATADDWLGLSSAAHLYG